MRTVSALKRVDWVGRYEDTTTVITGAGASAKWVWGIVSGVGAWIMVSPGAALLVAGGVGMLIALFGPAIQDELRERRLHRLRLAGKKPVSRSWRRVIRRYERLVADLERERLNPELGTLPHRNRRTLREVCRQLAKHGIQHPPPNPRPGETLEWENFIGNLVSFVEDGRANELPTLYEHLRVAYARRDTQRDVATILRRFQETDDAPTTEG